MDAIKASGIFASITIHLTDRHPERSEAESLPLSKAEGNPQLHLACALERPQRTVPHPFRVFLRNGWETTYAKLSIVVIV